VYAFGFTYIIWTIFFEKIRQGNIRFLFNDFRLFHGGGWKKMHDLAVSKEVFSDRIAEIFCTQSKNILDFYGMAEQTGIIFVDCECGNKHIPAFSQVIIRDPYTLDTCEIGKNGLIEVMSILADSYYDQAVLTEDIGVMIGVMTVRWAQRSIFRFVSRMKNRTSDVAYISSLTDDHLHLLNENLKRKTLNFDEFSYRENIESLAAYT
jgi:hypothetical protein